MIKKIFLIGLITSTSFSCWGQPRLSSPSAHLMTAAMVSSVRYPTGSMVHADRSKPVINSGCSRSSHYSCRTSADYKKADQGGSRHQDFNLKQPRTRNYVTEKQLATHQPLSEGVIIARNELLEKMAEKIRKIDDLEIEDDFLFTIQEYLQDFHGFMHDFHTTLSEEAWDSFYLKWLEGYSMWWQCYHQLCKQKAYGTANFKKILTPFFKLEGKSRRIIIAAILNEESKFSSNKESIFSSIQKKHLNKAKKLLFRNKPTKVQKRKNLQIDLDSQEEDDVSLPLALRTSQLEEMQRHIEIIKMSNCIICRIVLGSIYERMVALLYSCEDDEWRRLYIEFYESGELLMKEFLEETNQQEDVTTNLANSEKNERVISLISEFASMSVL